MTDLQNPDKKKSDSSHSGTPSLLFDQASLGQGIRVSPAQFSRMVEVSRQTVSRWVSTGLIQLFPDGRLDPAEAARRVVENSDPGRLRARLFKNVTRGVDEWRRQAEFLEGELKSARAQIQYLDNFIRENALAEEIFIDDLAELMAAQTDDDLATCRSMLTEMCDDASIRAGQRLGFIDGAGPPAEFEGFGEDFSAMEKELFDHDFT